MALVSTFRNLPGGAKLRLVAGFFLLLPGLSHGSGFLIVAGLGLLASFAWTLYRAHQEK